MKREKIILTVEQQKELESFVKTGVRSARLITRAKIILLLNESESGKAMTFKEVAQQLDVCMKTINNVKEDFLASGSFSEFLRRKKRAKPPVPSKINGEIEARIVALACSQPPEGYARWTLRLLADKSVELCLIDSISHNAIRGLLKKLNLSLT